MNPQPFQIIEENRKRSHSSSSSSNSPSASPSNVSSSDNSYKKRHINYSSTDSSSAESSSQPTTTTSSFYSNIIPPRTTSQRSVPAFLNKLYNMVEDCSTNDLVRWSKDGSSFIVEKHEEFAKTVLPRFYKHNTFASFVRQLNMYDFHKVPHIQQGVLIAENEHDIWEFSNPHFQKGRPDLLILVTRKRNRDRDSMDTEDINLASLIQSLSMIKKHQTTITSDLKDLHRDNEMLWQETLSAREKYQKHQEAIEKILQFLTTLFTNDNLAITMNNPDLLPKGLIEEAASLAGMPISKLNLNPNKSSAPLNSALATSALSNILSSVLRLYSTPQPIGTDPPPPTQVPPQDNKSTKTNDHSLTDFSKTLNTATRSAQSITQDIDTLQVNIESLANDLGIDPTQFDDELDLQDNYQHMLKSKFNYEEDDHKRPKNHKKLIEKPVQKKLQKQTRSYPMYEINDYRNYYPMNFQQNFNLPPNGYYPMGNQPITHDFTSTATTDNNNTMMDNPYIVPYYNNNTTNEENHDDNT